MVSMDGESHPEITLAAVGLGVLVACIILITLIAFITRRKRYVDFLLFLLIPTF